MANSVDPDQTAMGAVFWVHALMLDNCLQQTTSADDIFRCIFFLALQGLNRRL